MRNIIILLLFVCIGLGLGCVKKEEAPIKIGDIEVTSQEFQDAFLTSYLAKEGEGGKKEFLDVFISRKLMLKEAERLGLDKNPEFLKDIQLFWEQSLLKLVLSYKINELSTNIKVKDEEINEYYQKNKELAFTDKELSDVQEQIKWLIFKQKQAVAIQEWLDSLREKTKIDIDYGSLGIKGK